MRKFNLSVNGSSLSVVNGFRFSGLLRIHPKLKASWLSSARQRVNPVSRSALTGITSPSDVTKPISKINSL